MKKESSNWYIAATHYLTAGFAIPIIGTLIIYYLLGIVETKLITSVDVTNILITYMDVWSSILIKLFTLVLVWLGTLYSVGYLNKTYVIRNTNSIVNLSTIYFILVLVIFYILPDVMVYKFNIQSGISIVAGILYIIVFYITSKKYIKANR